MRNARSTTGWGAAALAAVLVATATATPATALTVDETVPSVAETSAPTSTPAPQPTESAEPTAAPEQTESPETVQGDAPASTAPEAKPAIKNAERSERAALAAAAAVGDVAVTVFDDRYADGIFDMTKVARNGESDTRRDAARLLDVNGVWHEGNDDDKDGVILFEDMPAGEAQVHVTYPSGPGWHAFFDATGATSAGDIERLPDGSYQGTPTAFTTVTVGDATATPVIGLTGLRSVAEVKLPDGSPAVGLNVDFGSHGQWFRGTDYGSINNAPNGIYEAFSTTGGPYQIHLPGELGVRLTAPGYRISEVTAISGGGNTTDAIAVTERDGAYWISSLDASSFGSNPTFTVELEALPAADLAVTEFDDRYADGIFDDTLGSGEKVDSQSRRLSHIVTSQGIRVNPGINDVGDYVFENVPQGETTVYFTHPNSALESVFFDATGAEGADDITAIDNESTSSYASAVATVDVDADGAELLVGFTALKAVADVDYEDGTPASGLTVEFGSAGEWRSATEYPSDAFKGQYEVLNGSSGVPHLPDEIGVRLTPPAGWEIGDVTAISSSTNTTDFIPVTEGDVEGEYWIDTVDASTYSANPTFQVTLVEAPSATVEVTYFGDVLLDGVYDSSVDLPIPGAEIYLQDGAGEWWATTALDGVYTFEGVAPGDDLTVYAQIPETTEAELPEELAAIELPEASLSLWDATDLASYLDTTPLETETLSFEDGQFIDPETGGTVPFDLTDQLVGVLPLETEVEDGEVVSREIGAATVLQLAAALDQSTSLPVEGLEIDFLANDAAYPGAEFEGAYVPVAANDEVAIFGAAEYGVDITAPAGYEVTEVAAINALTLEVLEITEPTLAETGRAAVFAASNEYRLAPQQVGGPFGAVVWAVQVAPIDPIDPIIPPALPGTDPGAGLPSSGAQPAAAPATLPATGSDMNAFALVFAAGMLIIAGFGARVVVRRRHS